MGKVVFLGFAIKKEDNHLGVHVSGNRMQNGFIESLYEKIGKDLSVLSVYPIAAFPKSRTIAVESAEFELDCGAPAEKIGFINIFGLKQLTQAFHVHRELKKLVKQRKADVVICFNPYWIFAKPIFSFSREKLKKICIIADIPVTIPKSYGFIKKQLRKYEIRNYYNTISKFDGLIVLNKEVINEFASKVPYVVMDGGICDEEALCQPLPSDRHNWNQLLFTGALEPYNCIREIVDAFLEANVKNSKLVLCGNGTLTNFVKDMALQYPSIEYRGTVTNDEAKELQRSSGVLLNIRKPDQFAMRLTFPSKVIEYMLSGTPVLTTPINGLGEEYLTHMYTASPDPVGLVQAIKNVCSLSLAEKEKKGREARGFILNNKTYRKHSEKIIHFIDSILQKGN